MHSGPHCTHGIFSGPHLRFMRKEQKKSFSENLVVSKKKGRHVRRSSIFRPKSSEEQKKGHHVRRP